MIRSPGGAEPTLVTGSAGKTGRAVVRGLVRRGLGVRALAQRARHRQILEELGVGDVVEGDLCREEDLRRAAAGAGSIYHICPNMHPDEVGIGRRLIAAAAASGVRHFVLHSVLHPQTEAMPHHWAKLRVEEHLFESGLGFTILQPAPYMQNLLGYRGQIRREGVLAVPYALATRLAMVDLEDVAEAAASVLTDSSHLGATYELCGPDEPDPHEIADLLAASLGSEVRARAVERSAWRARMESAGVDAAKIRTLLAMFRYYERHGMSGSPNVLRWLLGREPTSLAAFLARCVSAGQL